MPKKPTPTVEVIIAEIETVVGNASEATRILRQILRQTRNEKSRAVMGQWVFFLQHNASYLRKINKEQIDIMGKDFQKTIWTLVLLIQESTEVIRQYWE